MSNIPALETPRSGGGDTTGRSLPAEGGSFTGRTMSDRWDYLMAQRHLLAGPSSRLLAGTTEDTSEDELTNDEGVVFEGLDSSEERAYDTEEKVVVCSEEADDAAPLDPETAFLVETASEETPASVSTGQDNSTPPYNPPAAPIKYDTSDHQTAPSDSSASYHPQPPPSYLTSSNLSTDQRRPPSLRHHETRTGSLSLGDAFTLDGRVIQRQSANEPTVLAVVDILRRNGAATIYKAVKSVNKACTEDDVDAKDRTMTRVLRVGSQPATRRIYESLPPKRPPARRRTLGPVTPSSMFQMPLAAQRQPSDEEVVASITRIALPDGYVSPRRHAGASYSSPRGSPFVHRSGALTSRGPGSPFPLFPPIYARSYTPSRHIVPVRPETILMAPRTVAPSPLSGWRIRSCSTPANIVYSPRRRFDEKSVASSSTGYATTPRHAGTPRHFF